MRKARRARSLVALLTLTTTAVIAGCAFNWGFPEKLPDTDDGGMLDASPFTTSDSAPPLDRDASDAGHLCRTSADCLGQVNQFCHFMDYQCGKAASGICTDVPTGCTSDEVCACNGETYASECAANAQGFDLAGAAKDGNTICPYDAGTQFSCGTHICEQNKEYCLVDSSPVTYACKTPGVTTGTCAQLSCSCPVILEMLCSCDGPPGEIVLKDCH